MSELVIEIQGLRHYLGNQWIHTNVNLTVNKGEILGIIGGSGSGKTTIMHSMLMLMKPTAGLIKIFGQDVNTMSSMEAIKIRQRWGMMFQHSALFSALTVIENIMFPMKEFTTFNKTFLRELAMLKINLVGLPKDAADKFPAELSGGMQRRAAAARAIAMDPEILFLDEPTTGLDYRSARQLDELIMFLHDALQLTVVMITHDIKSMRSITDRVAFVGDGRIIDIAPIAQLMQNTTQWIAEYFAEI